MRDSGREGQNESPLKTYVNSTSNTQLLQYYAFKKLRPNWPKCRNLADIISVNLDKILAVLFDTSAYDRWQLSASNIAEINKIVWTRLELAVTKDLEALEPDHEKAIFEMLEAKQRPIREERESVAYEPVSVMPNATPNATFAFDV